VRAPNEAAGTGEDEGAILGAYRRGHELAHGGLEGPEWDDVARRTWRQQTAAPKRSGIRRRGVRLALRIER
jgi:hypothetical protein